MLNKRVYFYVCVVLFVVLSTIVGIGIGAIVSSIRDDARTKIEIKNIVDDNERLIDELYRSGNEIAELEGELGTLNERFEKISKDTRGAYEFASETTEKAKDSTLEFVDDSGNSCYWLRSTTGVISCRLIYDEVEK